MPGTSCCCAHHHPVMLPYTQQTHFCCREAICWVYFQLCVLAADDLLHVDDLLSAGRGSGCS